MITWNYRVFRDRDNYCIREVFYLDDGTIGGCTERTITPTAQTLDALTQEIENLKEALQLPILTLEEVDTIVAERPASPPRVSQSGSLRDRNSNISLEHLVAELGLDLTERDAVVTDPSNPTT
ncbi:hypothetical protein IQ249_25215 [Lusitaniella coriacea LEGE 07157]|uniref:Uncharacterized protein n=1 Tax=Lusitaniella coriacea LEGE 07157 TaxID=945747 RepID=A0A8J7IYN6_9CYAN|nr:hypothetical protein [Lusitaniella coriacea]MBE9119158.1 hypothetical protein [Lusitaniella coriacea LEGE 07157]